MDIYNIYIVQEGDTMQSIANKFNVSLERLLKENEVIPDKLAIGQTIVITYPQETYIVQDGDSIESIVQSQNTTRMQLLRNNNYLIDRNYIYPGEQLVIKYDNSKGNISTNGYATPFIDTKTLERTLPYLTYISIFGYRTTENAEIVPIEDTQIINISKSLGVAPLMLLSAISLDGSTNVQAVYDILLNEELSDKHIEEIVSIAKSKGYYGVNITYQFINYLNAIFYENYTKKLSRRMKNEGLKLFITVSPNIINSNIFEKINSSILDSIDGITIMNYIFGKSYEPPSPITSIELYNNFLEVLNNYISLNKLDIGCPIIGYDWELPFIRGMTVANALKLSTAYELAYNNNSRIQFDEVSKTPYFNYIEKENIQQKEHIVWFVDVRTINELLNLVPKYNLNGTGIWNIMYYFPQMWLVLNSQYKINKLFPEP